MSSCVIFNRLSPSIGTTKSLSVSSCKRIKEQLSTDCDAAVTNGLYWVQGMQVCIQYKYHAIVLNDIL